MNDPATRMSGRPQVALALRQSSPLVAVLLLACACATPIGVTHVDTQSMYRSLTSSVLSADRPSPYSEQLLTRLGLGERFNTDPELVLAAFRGPGEGLDREYLLALSELSFVRSSHSTQSTPATILEVRRILYEHLGIACGLECEVPERVEAAVAGTPKPEPPAVTADPAPKP